MPATDYSTYLRIDELLALQQPLTPGADDEMLFIIVHQAYELWFKLVLFELGLARDGLMSAEPWAAVPHLRRAIAVEELLYQQLGVLETMTPEGFLQFRDPLAPASGFQSVQFREIEILSGGKPPNDKTAAVVALQPAGKDALGKRAEEPTLWDGLCCSLAKLGHGHASVPDALLALYRHHRDAPSAALHQVAELLVDHDEAIARWRYRHALMAAREIGRRQGTGGSLGVKYLESTLDRRCYPLLWEVRSQL